MAVTIRGLIASSFGLSGVAGPVVDNQQFKMLFGEVTLVNGAASEVLSEADAAGIPNTYPLIIPWLKAEGGTPGFLKRAGYTAATRTIDFESTSGTDASDIFWVLLLPVS